MDSGFASAQGRLSMRLLGVTDLHANLYPYDYFRDRPDPSVGLSKTATLIGEARSEARNCLLFDNGDILQGTPLGDYAAQSMAKDLTVVHPVIEAMNVLDYAAATLGNHEFNYGLDILERAYRSARFPVVCTNIQRTDGRPWFPSSIVVERLFLDDAGTTLRLRIGVMGFAPVQIAQWDEAHVAGRLRMLDIVEAAQTEVASLRGKGVDLIVALCHSGISHLGRTLGEENAAQDLAVVDGVDAQFIGHQHLLFPGEDFAGVAGLDAARGFIHGKPAVMAGFWGSHLGIMDLALEQDVAGWRVVRAQVEARPIARRDENGAGVALVDSDPEVLRAASAAHEATLHYIRGPVGTLKEPLHTYLAMIADDPTVQLINEAQRAYAAPLAAAHTDLADLPIVSAAAPFKCGGRNGPDYYTDVARGPIGIKDVADIYPYPNSLRVLRVDGATVQEWLERSASIFLRIDPALTAEQPLLGPAFACYNFDVIDGVEYSIDVTQAARYDDSGELIAPDARRIRGLTHNGAPIDPKQAFLVVTNNYRASGGGGFPGCDSQHLVIEAPDANRDILVRYVESSNDLSPRSDGNWRLATLPATVIATYLTSPLAARLPPPPHVKLTAMGPAPGGFVKFRVETQ
ncbi:MAG: bifunctional 2',3'-cyclic-nucleotide 2'-phosphodiesterase/3'-nucleotidase [Hyphomicrobiales bacterium]|nr:bifunctional 2',3'-cyclic-nucleotide 2'-phosphodiesterase/3'-nucleotidase [Hyphomicrobiales bacterium]